jgi:hypothetical protein
VSFRDVSVPRCRRKGPTEGRIAALDETRQTPLEGATLQEHVPAAATAAQADVGAEAIDEPLTPAARVSATEAHDVTEPELDDLRLSRRHVASLNWWGQSRPS